MRITKKDIYAQFGIEYNPKTQKIKTPYGWTRELLKKGNSKVGANVKTWSILQDMTQKQIPFMKHWRRLSIISSKATREPARYPARD